MTKVPTVFMEAIVEVCNSKNEKLKSSLLQKIIHLPILSNEASSNDFYAVPLEIGEVTYPEKAELRRGFIGNGNYGMIPTRIEEERKSVFYIMGRAENNELIGTSIIERVNSPTCSRIKGIVDYRTISKYEHCK